MQKSFFIILFANLMVLNLQAEFCNKGIIFHNTTFLQWQNDFNDKYNINQYNNNNAVKSLNWEDALKYCKSLTLGGHTDWRLPNINELISKIDYSKINPAKHEVFTNITNITHSSTILTGSTLDNWVVNFTTGAVNSQRKIKKGHVRCVR